MNKKKWTPQVGEEVQIKPAEAHDIEQVDALADLILDFTHLNHPETVMNALCSSLVKTIKANIKEEYRDKVLQQFVNRLQACVEKSKLD